MVFDNLIISVDPNLLNNITFYDDNNISIGILDEGGLKFTPIETENKEDTAKRFIKCLKNLWVVPKDQFVIMYINNEEGLKYNEQGIFLTEDPSKPSDYWIFQSVKKLWSK